MSLADALFDLSAANAAKRVFVVGTAKNVGKTVTMRALAQSAVRRGTSGAVTSTGRDGEAIDVTGTHAKPRLFLAAGTVLATARALLPAHPACEILELGGRPTAAGEVIFARVRRSGFFELAGPSTASGIRDCLDRFEQFGCALSIVDGALDRIAALAGANGGAVILAAGAASATTMEEAVAQACALAMRLRVPAADPQRPRVDIDGALTPAVAAQLVARGEQRQVVVRDATHIVAAGRSLIGIMERLDVRCEHPIDLVAATVASIGPDRSFEPRAFARAVAKATNLPTFDIYAGICERAA